MTSSPTFAVDTSVAVPLLVASHTAHASVARWANERALALAGHALAETYSVLTRLPGDARLRPSDAVALIDENFTGCLALTPERAREIHRLLAEGRVAGGAVYDGLVALAARDHDVTLATRDARARGTYEARGARVHVIAGAPD